MSQLGLFSAPSPRRATPPVVAPAAASVPQLRQVLSYDDGPGCGVASYYAGAENPYHPDLECKPCVWGRLERHFGYKPHRWMASIYLELPDFDRSQWSEHAVFRTQDEAASELTDMILAAERLLVRALRGEEVTTPGRLRNIAAQLAADADPAWRMASEKETIAKEAMTAIGVDGPGFFEARAQWWSTREHAARIRRELVDAFHREHDWREFAGGRA